ncbi:hypothetical protein BASA83_013798 [Batrachochytrium salamandrivorans]|nr:hypothetical protein BASA83_013798 [Batrachochytrium salamandrivorans]
MDPSKISAVQDWPAPKRQEVSFKRLKDAFAQPGLLSSSKYEQTLYLETDASDLLFLEFYISTDQTNTLRPVAFYSRQMNNAERNYDIYDKETISKANSRQARWSLELRNILYYHSSSRKANGRADSLSRREDYFLDGDQSNFQRIIDPDNVLDLQVAMADLDLHVLVHSTV